MTTAHMAPIFRTAGIFKGALIGGVVAGAIDIALFFAGKAMGAMYLASMGEPGSPPMPVPPFMPMVNSVVGAVVGSVILAVLRKITPARAWPIFLGVSVVFLFLYILLPPKVFAGDTTAIVTLELMHVVTAAAILGGIWRWGRVEPM